VLGHIVGGQLDAALRGSPGTSFRDSLKCASARDARSVNVSHLASVQCVLLCTSARLRSARMEREVAGESEASSYPACV
jgi:hypothetical protein